MIQKLLKLKNVGVFSDYSWGASLADFKKFNLIYGWNRSGKTTISRVFGSIEKKAIHPKLPVASDLEIVHASGKIKKDNIAQNDLMVRVFNEDFIHENVHFDHADKTFDSVIDVGKEDLDHKKEIDALKIKEEEEKARLEEARTKATKATKDEDDFRVRLAKQIKDFFIGLGRKEKATTDKSDIKREIASKGIGSFAKVDDEIRQGYIAELSGSKKTSLLEITSPTFDWSHSGKPVKGLSEMQTQILSLLKEKVVAKTLARLEKDAEISQWVSTGLQLVKTKQPDSCLFCGKPFDQDIIETLEDHFSKEYSLLQTNLDSLVSLITGVSVTLNFPKSAELYPDLVKGTADKEGAAKEQLKALEVWKQEALTILNEKKAKPFDLVDWKPTAVDCDIQIIRILKEANAVIKVHNERVSKQDERETAVIQALESHMMADFIATEDYGQLQQAVADSQAVQDKCQADLNEMHEKIRKLEEQNLNIGKAVAEMNTLLLELFGTKELQLELDAARKVYILKRGNEVAKQLSQGEQTAIAFSFFVIKVLEKGVDPQKLIIFIDDPISSLDSGNVHLCFSTIKNRLGNVGQLFISTHNFEFFNLLKEWFAKKNRQRRGKGQPEDCGFYQVRNVFEGGVRKASLEEMESVLRRFNTEYHFLFDVLKKFLDDGSPELAEFYLMGNVARRFAEIFSNFQIPNTGDFASKFDQLAAGHVSDTDRDRFYKLINDYSHGGSWTEGLHHADKTEARTAVNILFDVLKKYAPKHFEILEKETAATA